MGILRSQLVNTGFADAPTNFILLKTDDVLADVTAIGYLETNLSTLLNELSIYQSALVYTTDAGTVWLKVVFDDVWSLESPVLVTATANVGGSGPGPVAVTVAGLTADSFVFPVIKSSTNTVAVAKCIATATGFNITFTADPGAACIVNYQAYKVGQ